MKKIKYILLLFIAISSVSACQKDTMKVVDNGSWNHERNIVEIKFENQIGLTQITRSGENAVINFKYNLGATKSKKIPLKALVASYGATIDKKSGDVLDFDNPTQSATLTVKAADGKTLVWTVLMTSFIEELEGKWSIKEQLVYGGTGPTYGGAQFKILNNEASIFNQTTGPKAEMDNEIEFKLIGFTEQGNSYGQIINSVGADGKYADYIYNDGSNPITDVNKFYRVIPTTGGTWQRDYTLNVVTLTFADKTTIKVAFKPAGYKWTFWAGASRTFTYPTIMVDLVNHPSSKDNWGKIYTAFDIYTCRPYAYWISVEKKN